MKLGTLLRSPGALAWTAAIGFAAVQACAGSTTEDDDDTFGGGPQRRNDAGTSSSSGGSSGGGSSSSSGGPTALDIVQISSLANHTCVVWNDGVLKCWGNNRSGQLGYGDLENRGDSQSEMGENLPPVELGSGRRVRRVAVGFTLTCALLDDSSVKCWGDNPVCGPDNDQNCGLGYGDQVPRGGAPGQMGDNLPAIDLGAPAKDLSCGSFSCCALLSNDTIKCWGENFQGVLGYGDQLARGNEPNQMGANLPPVDVGVSGVSRIRVGNALLAQHTCAALVNGEVKCWGSNFYGQLGIGDTNTRGDQANEMGTALPRVDVTDFVNDIAPGDSSTCARTAEGLVRCWGNNDYGQLGYGDKLARGSVRGQNFAPVQIGGTAVAIAAAGSIYGAARTCVVLAEGAVKCWGANDYLTLDGGVDEPIGRLGYGDTISRGAAPNQMGANLPAIDLGETQSPVELAIGSGHTCVRFTDGKVKCFGENFSGALGLGDDKNRGYEASQMGDALPYVDLGR